MLRAIFLSFALLAPAAPPPFKLIVHPQVSAKALSAHDAAEMFMKRSTTWADGSRVRPVDQAVTANVREIFSRAVHGKSARAVKTQWSQIIFTGQGTPPPEAASDAK